MQEIIAELLRKLEAATGRKMKPNIRDTLKSNGVLPRDWEERDKVKQIIPAPAPYPLMREVPHDGEGEIPSTPKRQQIIANLLREADIGAGGGLPS